MELLLTRHLKISIYQKLNGGHWVKDISHRFSCGNGLPSKTKTESDCRLPLLIRSSQLFPILFLAVLH